MFSNIPQFFSKLFSDSFKCLKRKQKKLCLNQVAFGRISRVQDSCVWIVVHTSWPGQGIRWAFAGCV